MNTIRQLNPLRELSPGEIAFDRCMLLIVLGFGSGTTSHFMLLPIFDGLGLGRLWQAMSPGVCGVVLAIFWIGSFLRVVDSWSDPVVRVLRFCSLAVLGWQGLTICGLFLGFVVKLVGLLTSR